MNSFTIQLTPINTLDTICVYMDDNEKCIYNNSFTVYSKNNIKFYWECKATRKDVEDLIVEPYKEDYILHGDGPYTYLEKK